MQLLLYANLQMHGQCKLTGKDSKVVNKKWDFDGGSWELQEEILIFEISQCFIKTNTVCV